MSISLPTYSRLELPLLGRRERVRAIIATGLRREFRRPAAIVVTVLGAAFTTITSIVPPPLTLLGAASLARLSWVTAGEAMGISLVIGGLLPAFSTAVTLFLSSLTRRKGIAAAGVFAVNFGLTVPAGVLAGRIGNPAILYLSPWDDYVAVANVAFGATPSAIDWLAALAVLLGVTVLAAFVTYIRMRAVEVITG